MKRKRFYLLLQTSIFVALIGCNQEQKKNLQKQSKFDWVTNKDSTASIIENDSYLFVIKKTAPGNKKIAFASAAPPISSTLAKEMVETYEVNSRGLRGKRAFFVTLPSKEVLDYLAAVGQDLSGVRIYFGAYPRPIDSDHPQGKFSAFLVAVANNQKEIYVDDPNSPLRIVNLGTLCPTICPPASDPNSIYARAGLSSIPQ